MRRVFTLSSELFKVPIEGLRALWASRRFRLTLFFTGGLLLAFCVSIACALQFWLFPRINDFKGELTSRVGSALGVAVEVGHLHGEWSYLHPRFVLDDVVVFDASHRPTLRLSRIGATLSWWQMLTGNLGFRALSVDAPMLNFHRDRDGSLFLSELPLDGGGDFRIDALLEQGELSLTCEQLSWADAMRAAPKLVLRDVNLRLRSHNAQHRLDISFVPPDILGSPFKGRIDWIGRSFSEWEHWKISSAFKMAFIDLAGWQPWFDYPVNLSQGHGGIDLKLEASGMDLTRAVGSLSLKDLKVRLAPGLDELVLKQAKSRIEYQNREEGRLIQLKLDAFSFTDAQGKEEPESDIFIERQLDGEGADGLEERLSFLASRLDLARLRALAAHLPVPESIRKSLAKVQPAGLFEGVKVAAQLRNGILTNYEMKAGFKRLSLRSEDGLHFVQGLTGKIDFNQEHGRLVLDSSNTLLGAPGLLPLNELGLTNLTGQISWQRDAETLGIKIKSLQLHNGDLQAIVNGSWSGKLGKEVSDRERAGVIDMKIVFDYAKTESAWKYVPLSASPDISAWMKASIADGAISDLRIEMVGPVWDMPYGSPVPGASPGSSAAMGVDGKFYLGFKTSDVTIKYAEGYPALKKLDATFAMNQNKIAITASDGQINDMRFSSIKAEVADVSAYENHLVVSGRAQGPTESAVRFLKETPVSRHIHNFADDMEAQGDGKLDITADLNLLKVSDIKILGQYTFIDNRLSLMSGTPPVSGLNGSIHFSESMLKSTDLQGLWSGQPLSVRIATDDAGTQIEAVGRASVAELRHQYDLPLFDQISGQTNWQAKMGIRGEKVDLSLTSDLKGIASSLSEPFNKSAGAVLPLSVVRKTAATTGARRTDATVSQIWSISLGNAVAGTFGLNNRGQIVRGRMLVGSGQAPGSLEQAGIQLESLKPVNLDYWLKMLGFGAGGPSRATSGGSAMVTNAVSIKAPLVTAFGRKFQDFRATVNPSAEQTTVQVTSKELQGEVDWFPPGKSNGGERGLLQGHLSRLDLTTAADSQGASKSEDRSQIESLPDLSLRVDELYWQGKPWGRLNFRAKNQNSGTGQSWRIDPFQLEGPDLRFTGRLNWLLRSGSASTKGVKGPQDSLTSLDFKMNSPQVGNLLTKLGYPGTVKRGTAQLEGQLSWPANPFDFDPGRLSGNFKMSAKNGQFAKMDPGVGRLLGLLSLQSLPQRFSLDFRDIFSEGLAFESIEGRFDIRDGLMKTSDLEMDAPAARILMRGETDLANQTQDVRVIVRPALSNSVALGVTVLNPIVGAAAFVTQKVLGDPLSKLFSYQYHITGTWADPQVDKESAVPTDAPASQNPVDVPVGSLSTQNPSVSPQLPVIRDKP